MKATRVRISFFRKQYLLKRMKRHSNANKGNTMRIAEDGRWSSIHPKTIVSSWTCPMCHDTFTREIKDRDDDVYEEFASFISAHMSRAHQVDDYEVTFGDK